ncbi:MAG: hypothetical protein IID42_12030 [Planctomycetes bacterium]|nr:hypothetical protein [Planctomycetota bacterium]
MSSNQYPATVVEVLDDQADYPPELLRVVRLFAASNPWKGSLRTRQQKFCQFNHLMAVACRIDEPLLAFGHLDGSSSGASHYTARDNRIVMVGKLSVVTFLHEFAHSLGLDEEAACRWSINLFRKCFPRQFSRLIHVGHMLIRPEVVAQRINCRTGARATRSREPLVARGREAEDMR